MAKTKKEAAPEPVRLDPRALAAMVAKELKLADDVLVLGEDLKHREVGRVSTGILALDVALGGGLPLNQWAEFLGHESSGKTALALKIVAYQQARDPEWFGVWVAAESLEEEYATSLGVDLERLLVVDTNSMEEAYDVVLNLAEKQAFDGVVIDSLPALIPTGEYEGQMEDSGGMAQAARLNGKFFRKMGADGNRSLVHDERPWIGILINQWRSKVGVMFGDPRTTPGGVAKNYACYTRLETRRDEWLDNGLKKSDPQHATVGQTIVAKIMKNKAGPPGREASFDFYFAPYEDFDLGDIDRIKDVFNTAAMLGVLSREGNSFYFLDERVGPNRPATIRALEQDPELLDRVTEEVRAHVQRKSGEKPEEKRVLRRKS